MGESAHPAYAQRPGPLEVIAAAVEGEVAELEVAEARYIKAIGGQLLDRPEGLIASHPALHHPTYNTVVHLASPEERFSDFVEVVEGHFAQGGVPFGVLTSAASHPPDADLRLRARGYTPWARKVWLELAGPVAGPPDDPDIDVRVTYDADEWAQTVAAGVGLAGRVEFVRTLARATSQVPTHRLMVATYHGKPVGGCELSVDNWMAALRHLSVVEAYRRKGVAVAMLREACEVLDDLRVTRLVTRAFVGTGADRLLERYGFVATHITEEFVRQAPSFHMD